MFPLFKRRKRILYKSRKIRRKDMLTEEQKREFENVFNFYSFQREYESEFRAEWDNKMWAFDTAVSILGYKFEPNCRVKSDGIECIEYNLVRS